MENETQVLEITPKNMFVPICITQAVCILVILIAVLIIKFFFDSGFMWAVSIPFAFVISRFTDWRIEVIYALCQGIEILKSIVGFILLKKGIWLNNIVENEA